MIHNETIWLPRLSQKKSAAKCTYLCCYEVRRLQLNKRIDVSCCAHVRMRRLNKRCSNIARDKICLALMGFLRLNDTALAVVC